MLQFVVTSLLRAIPTVSSLWSFLVIVELGHIAMGDGNIVVSIETTNSHGEKFLTGSAEVKQPTIVYVFTGQGSQELAWVSTSTILRAV